MRRAIQRDSFLGNEHADARMTAAFGMMGIMTLMGILIVLNASNVDVGPSEGQLAPNLVAASHSAGGSWGNDFVLYDEIDRTWEAGQEGNYFVIQFIDTDCSHCWSEGSEMSDLHGYWGNDITFITVAISLGNPGWESSRGEIAAFQEKADRSGCNGDNNCANRPGDVHNWLYLDDLDNSERENWAVPGTPFAVVLDPSGIVIWNGGQHAGEETLMQGLGRVMPEGTGGGA